MNTSASWNPAVTDGGPHRHWARLDRLALVVDRVVLAACVIVLMILVVVVLSGVVSRFVVGQPLSWTEEAARYLLIWLVLLGLAPAQRRGAHVTASLLAMLKVRGRMVSVVAHLPELLTLLIVGYCAYLGLQVTLESFGRSQTTAALGLPYGLVYLAAPVGLGLVAFQCFVRLLAPEAVLRERADEATKAEG